MFKYFLKSLPINDEAQRKYIESYGMFTKEGRLYKELLSKLGGADCKFFNTKSISFTHRNSFQLIRNGDLNVTWCDQTYLSLKI